MNFTADHLLSLLGVIAEQHLLIDHLRQRLAELEGEATPPTTPAPSDPGGP